MLESDFHNAVDAMLEHIENALDQLDVDIDSDLANGILTLAFTDRTKVIVNRQTSNREIWVAARSGGFHFRHDGAAWRDTRSHEQLDALLSRVFSEQSGEVISITLP